MPRSHSFVASRIDDLGKETVREGLRPVRLKSVKDKAEMRISFENGVIETHCAYTLRTEAMYSDGAIRELLPDKL